MAQINFIEIETKQGYKDFELHYADITNLDFAVDLMAISAFKRGYTPTPNTVIYSLSQKGLNVAVLAANPKLDLRDTLGIWISNDLNGYQFKNIVCTEIVGTGFDVETAIKNLFAMISILEVKGFKNESIAMPLLGTGNQNINPELVIKVLLENSLEFLNFSRYLKKIIFVVYDEEKAHLLNNEMNTLLGRKKVETPRGPLIDFIKVEINKLIDKLVFDKKINASVFMDLKKIINTEDFKSFEIGAVARRTLEYIIQDINPNYPENLELYKKIDSLRNIEVAHWIISYMHLIRIFGNEAVHHKETENRRPNSVSAEDLKVCLFCIQRVLEFYLNEKFSH
jgi:hypothetical protein